MSLSDIICRRRHTLVHAPQRSSKRVEMEEEGSYLSRYLTAS